MRNLFVRSGWFIKRILLNLPSCNWPAQHKISSIQNPSQVHKISSLSALPMLTKASFPIEQSTCFLLSCPQSKPLTVRSTFVFFYISAINIFSVSIIDIEIDCRAPMNFHNKMPFKTKSSCWKIIFIFIFNRWLFNYCD